MGKRIFLDHHTFAPPSDELIEKYAKEVKNHWIMGPTQKAEDSLMEILGAKNYHLMLKQTLSECHIHLLFSHYIDIIRQTGRTHILTLSGEQESILAGIKRLEKFEVQGKILPVNENGQLTAETLQEHIRARSSLLSLSLAHPKTGVIQPVHDLIRICKENDVMVHLDISAAIGKLYFQLSDYDVDYITFSGTLLQTAVPTGAILSKTPRWNAHTPSYAQLSNLCTSLSLAFDKIETYAMETGYQRDLLEENLEKLGAKIPYGAADRLPNVALAEFPDIHSEQIQHELKKEAIFIDTHGPFATSFVLSDETTREEITRLSETLPKIVEKLTRYKRPFSLEDAKAKNMRLCQSHLGTKEEGREVKLSLLIDEEDGVISDTQTEIFGPPTLHEAASVLESELLRKNYMQARRIVSDLIGKKMALIPSPKDLNLLIDSIDRATETCMDIPIEDIYVAPPDMENGERSEYPGWESLTNEQKKKVLQEVIERDVRPYAELDAGGVDILKVEDNRVTIAYSGNCTSCFSATGATLDAIGNILRHKVYPDLMVIPDVSLLNNS